MNEKLSEQEKEMLDRAKYIRRFLLSEIGIATTPLKDLLYFYKKTSELYDKVGKESDSKECYALYLDFSETDLYFRIAEEFLDTAENLPKNLSGHSVRIHYNLMEAYIERGEMEKAMEHKRKLDDYVDG